MPRKSRGVWKQQDSTDPAIRRKVFSSSSKREVLARRGGDLQFVALEKDETRGLSPVLPQLYRFCFLMTGDTARALKAFQNTLREAALLASRGQLPADRLWSFHEARHQCLALSKNDLQPQPTKFQEETIALDAAARVGLLESDQLAGWISSAPEPQRSALAFFYLNEFNHREMQNLLDVKMNELASLISGGRSQFLAWLNTITDLE